MTEDHLQVEDRPYLDRDGQTLLARIYRSSATGDGAGAVISVHPGAWIEGDRTWGRVYDEALAGRGFVVIALDFRQAPRFRHPAASADVATGVRWVRSCSEQLGVDPARIAALGSSSGGHLALLAACRPNEPEHAGVPLPWEAGAVREDLDAAVSHVAALWPPVDPLTRYEWLLDRLDTAPRELRSELEQVRRGTELYFGDRETMALASVPRVVRAGKATHLPPASVCYAELDRVVPFSIVQDLEVAWREAGGWIDLRVYRGQQHAFGHRRSEATDRLVDDLAAFFAGGTEGR